MIQVTSPFLPPISEFECYLSKIWESQWLTNMGPLSCELEDKLKDYLRVRNLLYVANGTLALQIAIKALGLTGEIITTPFTFVATTSSIVWEGCTPVFVDINEKSLTIDVTKIEEAITENTTAIVATHVYGNPCDVDAINTIARKYGLKVIYDAAHSFGVTIHGKSIFEFGDISTCSLHATKLYHSVEGGLIVTNNKDLITKATYMRNFGFLGSEKFGDIGINAKNCEFHAAMGLVNLKYLPAIHDKRKQLTERYYQNLKETGLFMPLWHPDASRNYAYLPVVFDSEDLAVDCLKALQRKEVYARRYFYPSLSKALPYLPAANMPISEDIASRVLCLPLYFDLSMEDVDMICREIIVNLKVSIL